MGKGKGRKRREANYRAAHGGHLSLPPPPSLADAIAIPSKLRHIISLKASAAPPPPPSASSISAHKPKGSSKVKPSKNNDKSECLNKLKQTDEEKDEDKSFRNYNDSDTQFDESSTPKTRKRKRNESMQDLMSKYKITPIRKGLSERKKKYLKDKKQKKKPGRNASTGPDSLHEAVRIGFGEVVEAPPKLSMPKKEMSISQERLRVQAVEAYRKKKQWSSRPGSHRPPLLKPVTSLHSGRM